MLLAFKEKWTVHSSPLSLPAPSDDEKPSFDHICEGAAPPAGKSLFYTHISSKTKAVSLPKHESSLADKANINSKLFQSRFSDLDNRLLRLLSLKHRTKFICLDRHKNPPFPESLVPGGKLFYFTCTSILPACMNHMCIWYMKRHQTPGTEVIWLWATM